jgi:DNA-binding NtrC family response regulator
MIDDDEEDFLLLQSAFHKQAPWVELTWFDSPSSFLHSRIWQNKPIHLLVFDLLVDEADPHWQTTIRQQVGLDTVPLVIHSGSESPGDREMMLKEGATDFMIKASTTAEMVQVVDRMQSLLA